jgi:hypothetical protein
MQADDLETVRRELARTRAERDATRAERDALRRELGDLRALLCMKLGIERSARGRQELTPPGVATDAEIVDEVQRLCDESATLSSVEGADHGRWSGIDGLIVEGRRIHAIQAIRAEFGTSLQLAVDLLNERHTRLRRRHPERFTESAEDYWDGFRSF